MALAHPRRFAPGVERVLGDEPLLEVASEGPIAVLQPERGGRDIAVLHLGPPDTEPLAAMVDRLWWLDGRGHAPRLVASGRSVEGDESAVIGLAATAAQLVSGLVPLRPDDVVGALAAALADVHAVPVDDSPFDASIPVLRAAAGRRVEQGAVVAAADGPYAGREPAELLTVLDALLADLDAAGEPRLVHGRATVQHVWIDPSGELTFTAWGHAGAGDPHHDLAVAAASLRDHFGPAIVAPFLDAYGLGSIDLRRLDAHQLLAHLLA